MGLIFTNRSSQELLSLIIIVSVTWSLTNVALAISPLQYEAEITGRASRQHFKDLDLNHGHVRPDYPRTDEEITPTPRYRLPGNVVPVHYNLFIRPVLFPNDPDGATQFTTPGNVTITVRVVEAGNTITMHAAELQIDLVRVVVSRTNDSSITIPVMDHVFNETNQSYELVLGRILEEMAEYNIFIAFVSRIAPPTERMNGIYWSSYLADSGETRYVATTQFSRTLSVRKSFPSFDEPNQKARFSFTIGRINSYHTLSNMDILETIPMSGNLADWSWDVYNTTPIMPATVIAFIISDFANETAPPNEFHPEKPVKIWGPPPMMRNNTAVFSASVAARTLRFFEDYFGIEYELPKMDSAAMPDFAAGAMENWGLNIYRTTLLLYYRGETSISAKYSMGNVIGHELAHQYWGNIVTHAWWNDWWLTEGTASYFEYIGFQAVEPSFEPKNRIVCDDMQPAMEFDVGPNSVPIHGPISDRFVENPSTINYQKGASLIRMLQGILSEEVFVNALAYYLRKRAYTAVDQDVLFADLHEYLEAEGQLPSNGKSMKEILDTWTLQTGFPLVRVSRATNSLIFISQERFRKYTLASATEMSFLSEESRELNSTDLWHVPVGYVTETDPEPKFEEPNLQPKFWIDKTVTLRTYNMGNTNQWLVINGDARSYYRVMYDNHFETLLRNQLVANHSEISIGSRSQLIDDYFILAYERYIDGGRALDMTIFLQNEIEYVVWIPAFRHLRKCLNLFSSLDAPSWEIFETYVKSVLEAPLGYVGLEQPDNEDDSPAKTIFRVPLLDWACTVRHEGCLSYATRLVNEWMESTTDPKENPVPVDIQASMYCGAVANGNEQTWNFILEQYKNTSNTIFLNSLACTNNSQTLERMLNMAITEGSDIPRSAAVTTIQRVAMNSEGRSQVISFLENNLQNITAYTGSVTSITSIVSTLSSYITSPAERNRIEALIDANSDDLESQREALAQHLATVDLNINWFQNVGQNMLTWFNNYNNNNNGALLVH